MNLLKNPDWPREDVARAQSFVLKALDVIPLTAGVIAESEPRLVVLIEAMSKHAYDPAFRDAVLRKWRSPEVSNVLRAHGCRKAQTGVAKHKQHVADLDARRHADIAEIGLRECAWLSCEKVECTVREFKQCSGCRSVWYCSPEHQMLDWGEHKKTCGELDATRKKAAKGGAGGATASA